MKHAVQVGMVGRLERVVAASDAIALGGRVSVYSTPSMIDLMEHAAREALASCLDSGEESVGVDVNVTHLAASPVGATVRAEARVTRVDGRGVWFDLAAFDGQQQIGRGTHERRIIDLSKLAERLNERTAAVPSAGASVRVATSVTSLPAFTTISFEHAGGIGRLTLNRPRAANAIDPTMTRELWTLTRWLEANEAAVRVMIVGGAGNAFCGGDDLRVMQTQSTSDADAWNRSTSDLFRHWRHLPQVWIAAINGACFGGGVILASACDFRFAAHSATFGMPEVNLGWPPSFGIPLLSIAVGAAKARELSLLGNSFDAAEAKAMGLVSAVHPSSQLGRVAETLARDLLSKPAVALRQTRQLLGRIGPEPTPAQERATHEAYMACFQTADAREGLAAFTAKRSPRFTDK